MFKSNGTIKYFAKYMTKKIKHIDFTRSERIEESVSDEV